MTVSSDTVTAFAPAKLNLCMHVTGQRPDGYHTLDSLVMFAATGDTITATHADDLSLTMDGPFADGLSVEADNLVLRAARLLNPDRGARIHLHKALPVAAGLGGGSSDAAAALRALATLWDMPLPSTAEVLPLGADVPVCLNPELLRMEGIGEVLTSFGPAPMLDVVLVNPGVALSTPTVFGGLAQKENPPLTAEMPDPFEIDAWVGWLSGQRNDLQAPAVAAAPVIGTVQEVLNAQPGSRLVRMSGSGATCFGIFEDVATRDAAVAAIRAAHPDWWVQASEEWNL
ncbi:MAG: 4-(cytidine 5'-diphospho)-2-C-methyl-D-erythritol kinase [Alphaproteobacteria bacterium]|jgi:4-diphosphocytidyl-2-C-methyl-D-erythritol kinase|nr:4-(cytidine 5'-diphospho)-2-C-methyl-D-erythritol kinase [Alphaproteobacteria bacterium]